MAARGEGEAQDDDAPMFATDDFRMYCMKIQPCAKRFVHDWGACPFGHPGEKAKRRDPRYFVYTGIACPSMKKAGACPRGEKCPYAHNVFEYWLHPTRYRTQLCNDGMGCRRRVCFFAHSIAQLRVPAVKPFVPPEVWATLEGPRAGSPAAMAAASEAMKRISDSWQSGSRSADQQPVAHASEAAQIESRVLEHLYGGVPADRVVQQLRTASEDTLAADSALQARLAGALAALKRSRSADDGQDALIQMLQSMLSTAARQQQAQPQQDEQVLNGSELRSSSSGNLWDQQQLLQQAQLQQAQLAQLQQAQLQAATEAQAQLYVRGSAEFARPSFGEEQQQTWARTGHSLPSLRENAAMPDGGGDYQLPEFQGAAAAAGSHNLAHAYPKIQALLGSGAGSSSSSYSLGSRPLTPSAAEEYASWVAGGGHEPAARRSLQQDARPSPAHGHYPRRRSLQVEDWRPAPNPFARVSDTVGPDSAAFPPVPLQGFAAGNQAGPYSNMFEGWQQAAALSGSDMVPPAAAGIQSTFLHPAPGSPGEMHFPSRRLAKYPVPRSSLDSVAPRAGGYPGGRQSIEVQPRPTPDAFAQRLSLDVNALRESDPAAQWSHLGSHNGVRSAIGSTARHSDIATYTGLAAPSARHSADYTTASPSNGGGYGGSAFSGIHARVGSGGFNTTTGGGAVEFNSIAGNSALQGASSGGGDQLGPLPTAAQLRRGSHSPATTGSSSSTPAQAAAATEDHLATQLGQLYMRGAPSQHASAR